MVDYRSVDTATPVEDSWHPWSVIGPLHLRLDAHLLRMSEIEYLVTYLLMLGFEILIKCILVLTVSVSISFDEFLALRLC